MRALMMTDIGVLELVEVPEPAISRPDDVLVEIRASGICGSDLHGYAGRTGRRTPPIVMGHEASGVVRSVGPDVEGLGPGDRVALHPIVRRDGRRRLLGMDVQGAYAPRVAWPASNVYPLPDAVTFVAGSLAEPVAVAIHAVERVDLAGVRTAVVVGAGPIGLIVASILRHRGVGSVAVTDVSAARLDVARRIGADMTIDPGTTDPGRAVRDATAGVGADAAFEAVGIGATVAQAHAVVRDGGTVVWIGNNQRTIEVDMQEVVTREITIRGTYGMRGEDFRAAIAMLADGAIPVDALVTRTAELDAGPSLFDELLASPEVVKCVFTFA